MSKDIRDGFLEISSGWMIFDDFDDLEQRIERLSKWTVNNGPLLPAEEATVTMMVQSLTARAIRRGDFEPYIPSTTDPKDIFK